MALGRAARGLCLVAQLGSFDLEFFRMRRPGSIRQSALDTFSYRICWMFEVEW